MKKTVIICGIFLLFPLSGYCQDFWDFMILNELMTPTQSESVYNLNPTWKDLTSSKEEKLSLLRLGPTQAKFVKNGETLKRKKSYLYFEIAKEKTPGEFMSIQVESVSAGKKYDAVLVYAGERYNLGDGISKDDGLMNINLTKKGVELFKEIIFDEGSNFAINLIFENGQTCFIEFEDYPEFSKYFESYIFDSMMNAAFGL